MSQEPTSEEGDFSSCPKGELRQLYIYEYKREISSVRKAVEAWRANAKDKTFESYCELAKREGVPSLCSPVAKFFLFPEWPSKPYLSIPKHERDRRKKWFFPESPNYYKASALAPFVSAQEWPGLIEHLIRHMKTNPSEIPTASILSFESAVLALLQIDWCFKNDALVDQFRAFLECHRPAGARSYERTKGKGSDTELYLADLKASGAYRLRRFNVKADDISLYSQATSVRRAVKRGTERIKGFERLAVYSQGRHR